MSDSTTVRDGPLAFLCHPYHRGGVTQWMVDAAVEWVRRGNPCWFVVPRPTVPFVSGAGRPTILELLEPAAAGSRLSIVATPVGRSFELGSRRWRAHRYASALVAGVPVGVPVIVSDDEPVWRASAWCTRRNPMVGVLHGDDPHYYGLAKRYCRQARALVAVSRRVRQNAIGGGVNAAQLSVIPCGVSLGAPRVTCQESEVIRLLWIGRIEEERKRASDIVPIAARLREEGVPFRLEVIGDGPVRAELEAAISAQSLAEHVRMLGWKGSEEIRRALRRGDVLLSTSNFEGMPLVVMEAMAAGCAVVASRVSGIEDYDTRPDAALCLRTYPTGDVVAAVRAIREASRPARERVAREARAFAETEFSIERCMERYAAILRPLAPVRGARPRLWPHRLAAAASPVLAFARSVKAGIHPSFRLE